MALNQGSEMENQNGLWLKIGGRINLKSLQAHTSKTQSTVKTSENAKGTIMKPINSIRGN